MGHPSFRKHLRVAIALSLCVYCSRRYTDSFTSALLTVSCLLLSTSFPLLLPKIKVFYKVNSIGKPQFVEVSPPKEEPFRREDGSGTTVRPPLVTSSTGRESMQEKVWSHCLTFDGEPSPDASISDDENLIELELPEGHYVEAKKPRANYRPLPDLRGGFLPCFLPESVFRQRGFKELLLDINEEDNFIEIDITRGSIKCPRLEIKV